MSLELRLGDQTITADASNIQTKNIAAGGYASVTFNVKRALDQSLFDTFTDVFTYDPATGDQTGGGRLLEQGRNDDGTWQVTCLGEGLASMQDVTTPYFLVDNTLDYWRRYSRTTSRMKAAVGTHPGYNESVLLMETTEGITMAVGSQAVMLNRLGLLCDQSIGGFYLNHREVISNTNWRLKMSAMNSAISGGDIDIVDTPFANALSSRIQRTVNGDIASATRPVLWLEWYRVSTTVATTEDHWSGVRDIKVRAQIYGTDGNLRTTGYTNEYILPHEALTDWVVRYCPRLNAATGTINTSSTEQIEQMAYLDGVHGMQLAEDVRAVEPAFLWQVWEQGDDGRWPFHYVSLGTEVQYEATVDDGFNAPSPSSEIYNKVTVTGKTPSGRDINVTRTSVVPALDDAGIVREATIPLGSEVWSTAAANKVGDEYLAEHATPPNAGTITIAHPIFDNFTGRWVEPCNIRSGGLIRVRGIQPTPDTLNATSPDGVTVFRVVSALHSDDTNSTVCELDSFTLTESRSIADLARARIRRG